MLTEQEIIELSEDYEFVEALKNALKVDYIKVTITEIEQQDEINW